MNPLDETLLQFLADHHRGGPLLLALSGGSDSLALFYALVRQNISFEAVHIDHGWREESCEEAEILSKLVQERGVPFHLKRMKKEEFSGNLEEAGRKARHHFFQEVAKKRGAEAVLLAHHQGDLIEGVLKRVFEGLRFHQLNALLPVTTIEGLTLFRPWLVHSKEEIAASFAGPHFEDPTNLSSKFLRGRFRKELIPELSRHFGKRIEAPLLRLADEAKELSRYLDHRIAPYLEQLSSEQGGLSLAFGEKAPLPHPYELHHLLERILREFGAPCRKKEIKEIISFLLPGLDRKIRKKRVGDIEVTVQGRIIYFQPCDLIKGCDSMGSIRTG